MIYI
ncbi:hypothetical protein D032_0602A, partial [Vibrio parahaemolyticus V14/01]|jgi:hypothetical protein